VCSPASRGAAVLQPVAEAGEPLVAAQDEPHQADADEVAGQQPIQRLDVTTLLGRGSTLHQVGHVGRCGHLILLT
jgi:hypothetical protein